MKTINVIMSGTINLYIIFFPKQNEFVCIVGAGEVSSLQRSQME